MHFNLLPHRGVFTMDEVKRGRCADTRSRLKFLNLAEIYDIGQYFMFSLKDKLPTKILILIYVVVKCFRRSVKYYTKRL